MDQLLEAQLRATLNVIPAYTWYAAPSGGLTFVNERCANYLGLASDHPLRLGTAIGAAWDSHLALLHPDDQEETRRIWSACLSTGNAGEVTFRVGSAKGSYRWFLSRAEPVRTDDGTVLYWIGINFDIEERKQVEVELRRSRAYLAEAQRLSRTGFVGMEARTRRIFWSEEAARIYGYPPGTEPTPDLILQRSHPDDVGLVTDALERAAHSGNTFDYEHRLLMPDGSIKHLHDLAHRVRDEAGHDEVVGAIVDITERKVAEEAIRRSEAYLAEAQELSHTGSFGWKVSSGEIFWSDETFRIFQCDPGTKPTVELVLSRVHPDDRTSVQQEIDRAPRDGEAFDVEHRLQLPEGSVKHVRVTAHPSRDSAGDLEFVGAITDVTQQRSAEAVIRTQEAELRDVVDTIPAIVWSARPDGANAYVNSRFVEYCGMRPAASLWKTRFGSADQTVNIVGIYSVAFPCVTRLATLSNGMASLPTSKIESERKTKSATKRQNYGRRSIWRRRSSADWGLGVSASTQTERRSPTTASPSTSGCVEAFDLKLIPRITTASKLLQMPRW